MLIVTAFFLLANMLFNLAHWVFAFSYFVLSYRIEQIKKNLPEGTYSFQINLANILVWIFNVGVPVIAWIFIALGQYNAYVITSCIWQASLVMSAIVLVWGIYRMVIFYGSFNEDMLPNKMIISMHIIAYVVIIIINIVQAFFSPNRLKSFEISYICGLTIYSVCTFILGLIVNMIVNKISNATN